MTLTITNEGLVYDTIIDNKVICPKCGANVFYTIEKRTVNDVIRRRRKCQECLHRITTHEVIVKRS